MLNFLWFHAYKRISRTSPVLRSIVLAYITVNLDGMAHTSMRIPTGEGPLAPDQRPGLLLSLDHDSARMVRETVAGNECVAATRWKRVSTVSVPVLRSTPGGPHLPPYPLPLPVGERKGNVQRRDPRSPNPSRAAPGVACSAAGTCG